MSNVESYVGLGGNLGQVETTFNRACRLLEGLCRLRARSSLYRTRPYGYADQPEFLNAVIQVETCLEAHHLLARLQDTERACGKEVVRPNGPRTLDLDLLFYGDEVIAETDLRVPHPGTRQRDFVVLPMAELAPSYRHPETGETMEDLARQVSREYFLNCQTWRALDEPL